MDNKRGNGTRANQAPTKPGIRWVAVIVLCLVPTLVGLGIFGPALLAQDKKGASDFPAVPGGAGNPFPTAPIAPPIASGPKAGSAGKVGFVTVDPYDFPPLSPVAQAKKPTDSGFKLPDAPIPPPETPPTSNRVNPFPVVVEKPPQFGDTALKPIVPMKNDFKAPVFPTKGETPKTIAETPKRVPASLPVVAQSQKPFPLADNEVKPIQHVNLFKEKLVPPPIVLPAPQLEGKEQPVPVQLPQPVPLPGADKPGVLPQPRPVPLPGLDPGQLRLGVLGDDQLTPLGATPVPTKQDLDVQAKYQQGFIDPRYTLDLIQSRARLMVMKETPKRIQVSDESILSYTVLANKEITLLGKNHGTTVLTMWFTDVDDRNKEIVLSYLVRVFPDPDAKNRLERIYRALEIEINKHFPDSLVRLKLVGDKVMVTGQAHDIFEATQILKVVVSNSPGASKVPSEGLANAPRPEAPNSKSGATPGQENYISSGSPSVINMLRIGGVQQVMLRVVVAEVNRAAARSIGLNFSLTNDQGITYFQNLTGAITPPGVGQIAGGVTPLGNLPIRLDNGQVALSVNALKRLNYAKSLAEPNLVALNGQPASFLAGGQFPVPVVSGNAVGGLQGTSFVPFGVQLQFTPYITDKDRIRLNVNATVSTRDVATGTNLGGGGGAGGGLGGGLGGGTFVPGLTARTFSSTVEMRDGQTLAVAGLIQTNHGADRDQIPFIGDIPFINRFTGFDRTSASEQELVILITPELVQPMYHQQLPRLPGSDLFEPSDLEFYLCGRLEGRRMNDFRSPVMNDIHRIRQYNRVEQNYIYGPAGFYNVPLIPK